MKTQPGYVAYSAALSSIDRLKSRRLDQPLGITGNAAGITTIPVYQSKFSRPSDGFLFVCKTRCTTEICKIDAVSVSFANGTKRRENVSPSLFSGDDEGHDLLV